MQSNWLYRGLALFLAVFCWYLVTGRERVDSWVRVKVETAGLQDTMILRGAPRDHIDVLVRGPKGLVRKIEPGSLVYTLDARQLTPGANTVVVEPGKLALAKLFDVVEVRPSSLELDVERRVSRSLPVHLALKDNAARDYKVSVALEPHNVNVTGPESVVQAMREVFTQPVGLPGELSGRHDAQVSLVLPEQAEASPRAVKAQISYQLHTREAAVEVPLRLVYHGRQRVAVSPDAVMIRVKAPVTLLREGAWRGLVDAHLEAGPELAPGRHEIAYKLTLPQGCELIEARPGKATVLVR